MSTDNHESHRSRRGPTRVTISDPDPKVEAAILSALEAIEALSPSIDEQADDEAEWKDRLIEADKLNEAVSRPRAKATKTREDKINDLFSFVVRSNTPKVNSEGVEVHRDLLMTWLYGRPAKSAH